MSLFDFFFPEQATASHLRRMANRQEREAILNQIRNAGQESLEIRIEELERDLGIVTLVLASLLEAANDSGTISRDKIKSVIDELDILDGFKDGRIHAAILRKCTQ